MTRKVKNPVRDDLYCPFCGHQGMKECLSDVAMSGKKRYACIGCKSRTTKPAYAPIQVLPKTKVTRIKKKRKFIITSAVNDTELVMGAHGTFKKWAEENDAEYLIIPGVYKNPDLMHQGINGNYSWPDEILPHLCNADVKIGSNIVVKGETRIQYTAVNPLNGLNHAGGIDSEIYGHPQIAAEPVATPRGVDPKYLMTTGSISKPNYGDSLKARKAEFHHSISALVIEVEGKNYWSRQVHYDGSGAYDLDKYYTPAKTTKSKSIAGLIYGDTHIKQLTEKTEALLQQVTGALRPKHKVFHDLHDHDVGSHHKKDDVITLLKQAHKRDISIRDELMLSVKFLDKHPGCYLVESNHHRHLNQWFNRFNPKNDQVNLDLYYELGALVNSSISKGGTDDLFRLFCEKYCKVKVNYVDSNDNFEIEGVNCSQHGDRGPNGSRGSAAAFAKTGVKTMIGHSHSWRIIKGAYQVGASVENLGYENGFSTNSIAHGVIYRNGKRAIFSIKNDKLSPMMRVL